MTLLLFTIGLKFDARTLLRPQTWGTATAHMAVLTAVGTGFIGLLAGIGFVTAGDGLTSFALVAFALSFSSTVLVVKILEGRSDDGAYDGQTAIGILVVQDLAAVVVISASRGEPPTPWALALVGLVPAAWLLRRLLARIDQTELLVLLGVTLALGPGYWLFDLVGLKGDLGALASASSSPERRARTASGRRCSASRNCSSPPSSSRSESRSCRPAGTFSPPSPSSR